MSKEGTSEKEVQKKRKNIIKNIWQWVKNLVYYSCICEMRNDLWKL